jgi:hypothetical protein
VVHLEQKALVYHGAAQKGPHSQPRILSKVQLKRSRISRSITSRGDSALVVHTGDLPRCSSNRSSISTPGFPVKAPSLEHRHGRSGSRERSQYKRNRMAHLA